MSSNQTLVCLHLSNNPIEFDEETVAVLTSIRSLKFFKGDNKISDEAIDKARDLCAKTDIQEFDLTAHGSSMNPGFLIYRARTKRKAEELSSDDEAPEEASNPNKVIITNRSL